MLAPMPPAGDAVAVAADAGALLTFFGQATLAQIECSAKELGRAGSLLGDAMAVLRRHFAGALAVTADGTDAGACRSHLDAAMVALQCEDALIQMLQGTERRTLQTADALRHVLPFECERSAPVTEALAARLLVATAMLETGIAHTGPVMQQQAVVGTVDMF